MKKILSCFVALFAAVSLYATDLNIYASGLKVHQTASGATIDYFLNAPASALAVKIYGPANALTPVKTIDLSTDAANLTKGAHEGVVIDLSDLADAVYSWKMEATGEVASPETPSQVNSNSDPAFMYYFPQDVLVDNNENSPYFGRVYVSECDSRKPGNMPAGDHSRGIYIYNSDLTFVNGQTEARIGYDGNIGGSTTSYTDFNRLCMDDEGYVYVASRGNSNKGVYRMDPANPTEDFVKILNPEEVVNAIEIVGSTLYTLEGVSYSNTLGALGHFNTYQMTNSGTSLLTSIDQAPVLNFANAYCSIRSDGRGGLWMSENRGAASFTYLAHMNANGDVDYILDSSHHPEYLPTNGFSIRGVVAVSPSGNMIAMGSKATGVIFDVSYDAETGVPTLSPKYQINTYNNGTNVDGVAFDVADNFYMVCATRELLQVFALPKASNTFTTSAPSSEYISLPCVEHLYEIGDNQGWALNAGVEMTKIATNVFQGEFTFANATSYFTLSAALGTSADDWATVNASRYGADNGNEPIANGDVKALHLGWTNSFAIPAGKYRITADLNALTVTVKQLWDNIYMFNNITGEWVLGDGVALTKTAENVFELDECEIPEGKYIIFSTTHGADWTNVNAGRLYPESVGNFWVDGDGYAFISATPDDNKTLLVKAAGKYAFTIDLNEGKIFYTQLTAKVDVTSAEYATYFKGTKAYTMPTGMKGYVFNVANRLEEVYDAGDIVPAATPLVLGAAEGTYDLVFTTGGVAPTANSLLVGSDEAVMTNTLVSGEHIYYGLSLNSAGEASSVGFYWMAANGDAFENGAHKAFLAVPVLTYQEQFLAPARILFNENGATGIENVEGQEKAVKFIQNGQIYIQKNGVVYDAMGRVIR